jgi:hypothetical protein
MRPSCVQAKRAPAIYQKVFRKILTDRRRREGELAREGGVEVGDALVDEEGKINSGSGDSYLPVAGSAAVRRHQVTLCMQHHVI